MTMKKLVCISTLLFTTSISCAQHVNTIGKGDIAINFSARTNSGDDIQLSDFEGRYVLLDFTHIGCGPCWQSYPHLAEVQEKYKDELEVITFHIDDLKDRWFQMAESRQIEVNWLTLWDIDEKELKMKEYQINGFPYYFLIDKEGIIVEKIFGYSKSKINNRLKKHLQ
jgi:thiol-disulfide isomerase/thioredoxin